MAHEITNQIGFKTILDPNQILSQNLFLYNPIDPIEKDML